MRLRLQWSENFKVPHSHNAKLLMESYRNGKRQVCLSGMRSSGKTSAIWPYVLNWCCNMPGFSVTIARKEYSTLVSSTMETLNEHILKYPFYDEENNPWKCDGGMNRPRTLIFHNGSRIRLMGLKDPEQVKGQEPNIFWHNEASREKTPKPWILVSGSQTAGRGGNWKRYGRPFSQIIADTNPDAPTLWLYKFFHDTEGFSPEILARRQWIDYQLTDNPAYSDDGVNRNTLGDEAYQDLLSDHPPGIDRDRYVFGKWSAAEGAVLQNFDFRRHVITELPDMSGKQWVHYRGVDFGDDDPFVCLWSSLNKDNGLLVTHREWRKSQTDIDDHAHAIHGYSHEKKYQWTVADSAHATERRHLRKQGIPTVSSPKDIREGVRLMKKRIDNDQWVIFKNLLQERDTRLVRKNEPLSLLDEIGAWVYPEIKTGNPNRDDLPDRKCSTHGIDPSRYKIAKIDRVLNSEGKPVADWTIADLQF